MRRMPLRTWLEPARDRKDKLSFEPPKRETKPRYRSKILAPDFSKKFEVGSSIPSSLPNPPAREPGKAWQSLTTQSSRNLAASCGSKAKSEKAQDSTFDCRFIEVA